MSRTLAQKKRQHTFLEGVANLDFLDPLLESLHELVVDAGLDEDCSSVSKH